MLAPETNASSTYTKQLAHGLLPIPTSSPILLPKITCLCIPKLRAPGLREGSHPGPHHGGVEKKVSVSSPSVSCESLHRDCPKSTFSSVGRGATDWRPQERQNRTAQADTARGCQQNCSCLGQHSFWLRTRHWNASSLIMTSVLTLSWSWLFRRVPKLSRTGPCPDHPFPSSPQVVPGAPEVFLH